MENSGYLKNLHPGDVILADRGFNVADSIALFGATLEIPAFTERIIGSVHQDFQILSATGVLQNEFVSHKTLNGNVIYTGFYCQSLLCS